MEKEGDETCGKLSVSTAKIGTYRCSLCGKNLAITARNHEILFRTVLLDLGFAILMLIKL